MSSTFLSCRFGYENISMAIVPLLLILKEHLSVNGEKNVHLVLVNELREAFTGSLLLG